MYVAIVNVTLCIALSHSASYALIVSDTLINFLPTFLLTYTVVDVTHPCYDCTES